MSEVNRSFNWVSSLDKQNFNDLNRLQKDLVSFYKINDNYYTDIDFTSNYWSDNRQLLYTDIKKAILNSTKVIEVGCGSANCLLDENINKSNYTGIDFSEILIKNNKIKFPEASFVYLDDPYSFPFDNEKFDLVFSVFVIEHTVFPNKFLDECSRILRTNGTLIVLSPDFLGCSYLTSQRTGLGIGTGREKLKKGRIFDALLTGYDNKIRMPIKMHLMRKLIKKNTKFFINLKPTCFTDPFTPDVDAVYIAYESEIKNYLNNRIRWIKLSKELEYFAKKNKLIFAKGIKVKH
ncbi:MAG: hypothetical protein B6D44_01210 [Ignavibacteriales bacterium UTCHB2]|jgi:ubiquinone/menaquinone biosynthesis C-methylase UbiE|nr:MAG: hypothetical protein B6D44_01210 [Ignavibacteriales bacterium UTCHB2]